MFREFTDKEIRPRAQKMDETAEMDMELWNKMAELGTQLESHFTATSYLK